MEDILHDPAKLIFCVIVFMAISEFIVGFIFLNKANRFMANAVKTMAKVKGSEKRVNSRNATHYFMLDVSFKDGMGQDYDSQVTSSEDKQIGDDVEILYDQNRPEKVKPNNKLAIYILPIAMMGAVVPLGVMLFVLVHQGMAKIPF